MEETYGMLTLILDCFFFVFNYYDDPPRAFYELLKAPQTFIKGAHYLPLCNRNSVLAALIDELQNVPD